MGKELMGKELMGKELMGATTLAAPAAQKIAHHPLNTASQSLARRPITA
jgi:hypothetical protein